MENSSDESDDEGNGPKKKNKAKKDKATASADENMDDEYNFDKYDEEGNRSNVLSSESPASVNPIFLSLQETISTVILEDLL